MPLLGALDFPTLIKIHQTLSLLVCAVEQEIFFFLNGPFLSSFSLFLSFQYTVDSKQMFDIN